MPRNHGEILLNDQSRVDSDSKKTTTRRKKKKKNKDVIIADDDLENTNQLVMSSNSKPKKRFLDRIRKKPKSPKPCSGSHNKGSCFRLMRHRRTEEDDDDSVPSPVSDPNDERFTHEMLRVMLETNDFGSSECNPHR